MEMVWAMLEGKAIGAAQISYNGMSWKFSFSRTICSQ